MFKYPFNKQTIEPFVISDLSNDKIENSLSDDYEQTYSTELLFEGEHWWGNLHIYFLAKGFADGKDKGYIDVLFKPGAFGYRDNSKLDDLEFVDDAKAMQLIFSAFSEEVQDSVDEGLEALYDYIEEGKLVDYNIEYNKPKKLFQEKITDIYVTQTLTEDGVVELIYDENGCTIKANTYKSISECEFNDKVMKFEYNGQKFVLESYVNAIFHGKEEYHFEDEERNRESLKLI
ncbi:hypothetical protein IGI03_05570 [Bacillus thuringiensis]|uniref:hypothetical protein n=1 Tax=Bacillus thuringiensis TaxID=1428 RepID=UPI0018740D43|nr:hypothetical protein [Bacillus thuringiensis]MBE5087516.1 hypothetical protein [Bacillus thuringiensis]